MSFILDGLKKVEEDRHRHSVPNLLTVHTLEFQKSKKRPAWPYFILAALFLNALIIAIWLRVWRHEEVASVKHTEIKKEESTINRKPPAPEVTAVNETRAQDQNAVKTENIIVNDKGSIKTHITADTENDEYMEEINIENSSPETLSFAGQNDTVDNNAESGPSDKAVEFQELPLNIRESLPDISISAHIYSNNPSSRLVNINGNIIHEGGTVTSDIKVDEITINGVILKYRGYRFNVRGL